MFNKKYILVKVTSEEENELTSEFLEQLVSSLAEAAKEKKVSLKLIEEYKKFPLCDLPK